MRKTVNEIHFDDCRITFSDSHTWIMDHAQSGGPNNQQVKSSYKLQRYVTRKIHTTTI